MSETGPVRVKKEKATFGWAGRTMRKIDDDSKV